MSSRKQIDDLIAKYGKQHSALIPLLHAVQEVEGYLSKDTIRYVADHTGIPAAEIYGVATFYALFRLTPQGKHLIRVCKGTACHVSGANPLMQELRNLLSLKDEEDTTADGRFTVMEVACLGCCSLAPVIMVDDQTFGTLTPEKLPSVIERFAY